jgi:LacI family transcriptional regulator
MACARAETSPNQQIMGAEEKNISRASPPARRPTIKEVAKLAGVSFKTVARVVNNEASVTLERREAVHKAMAMLNYAPNVSARQLASKRSYLMAMVFGGGGLDNFARAQTGAIRRCREVGYQLIVEEVVAGSETEVANRLHNSRVDGVVVLPPLSFHPPLLEALRERGLRYALISPDGGDPFASSVGLDDKLAGERMTELLISLGHRNIGFISGGDRRASTYRRLGYRSALEKAGLPARPEFEAEGDFTFRSGEAGARRLLSGATPPTAIFAANDGMALGVMVAAARLGLRVPEDLSVAGFDDMPYARLVWPELTTVRRPLRDMASTAVDLLLEPEEDEARRHVVLDFEIIERGSTGPHHD